MGQQSFSFLAGCFLSLAGCALGCAAATDSDVGSGPNPFATKGEAVLAGSDAEARRWNAVGALLAPAAPELGLCTGTLIGPTTVLTAKHCVLGAASLPELEFVFAVGPDALAPRATYPVSSWATEPSVEPRVDLKYGVFGSDVAVAHLAEPVAGIRPLQLGRLRASDPGRRFLMVGYGVRDEAGDFGLRQKGHMTLRGIGGNYADYAFGGFEEFAAAASSLPAYSTLPPEAVPQEYERLALMPCYQAVFGGERTDAQTCGGDSGAPYLTEEHGGLAVVALAGAGDLQSANHICDFGSIAAVLTADVQAFLRQELGSIEE